jgi:hypothetical protein
MADNFFDGTLDDFLDGTQNRIIETELLVQHNANPRILCQTKTFLNSPASPCPLVLRRGMDSDSGLM